MPLYRTNLNEIRRGRRKTFRLVDARLTFVLLAMFMQFAFSEQGLHLKATITYLCNYLLNISFVSFVFICTTFWILLSSLRPLILSFETVRHNDNVK